MSQSSKILELEIGKLLDTVHEKERRIARLESINAELSSELKKKGSPENIQDLESRMHALKNQKDLLEEELKTLKENINPDDKGKSPQNILLQKLAILESRYAERRNISKVDDKYRYEDVERVKEKYENLLKKKNEQITLFRREMDLLIGALKELRDI
jgi:chromosome segregation ATPase